MCQHMDAATYHPHYWLSVNREKCTHMSQRHNILVKHTSYKFITENSCMTLKISFF